MEFGTILFYKDDFYIIKSIEDDTISLLGEFYSLTINKEELTSDLYLEIPQFYIDNLLKENAFISFTKPTFERGKDYYNNGNVEYFYIDNGKLYASVSGREDYNVELNFKSLSSCDCPVGYFCKHIVASCLELKRIFTLLIKKINNVYSDYKSNLNNDASQVSLDGKTKSNNYDKFFKIPSNYFDNKYPVKIAREYNDLLAKLSKEEKLEFLDKLEPKARYNYDFDVKYYLSAFFLDHSLHEFKELISCETKYHNIRKKLDSYKPSLQKGIYEPKYEEEKETHLFYLYINNSFEELLKYYLNYYIGKSKCKSYLDEALKGIDKDKLNQIFASLNYRTQASDKDFKSFIPYLNEENYKSLINSYPTLILEDTSLNVDFDSNYLFSIKHYFFGESLYKFILKFTSKLLESPREFSSLIFKCYKNINNSKKEKELIEIAKQLPNSKYFLCLLSIGYFYDLHRSFEVSYFNTLNFEKILKSVDPIALFSYFDFKYEVCEDKTYDEPVIYALLIYENITLFELRIINDNVYSTFKQQLDNMSLDTYLYAYLLNKYSSEINAECDEIYKNIENRHYEENLANLNRSLDIFSRDAFLSIGASGNVKTTLEVEILLNNNNRLGFSLKISKADFEKFYKVKSLNKFVKNFYNEDTIAYGKSLTFKHDVNYLVDPYKELVLYLMQIYHFSDYNEGINLNPTNFAHIFEILKNSYVLLNGKKTLINCNPLKIEYFVEDNYILKTSIEKENKIINLNSAYYVYLVKDNELRCLDVSPSEKPLFDFFISYQGSSIEPVKDKFRDVIYSMYSEKININDTKKDDFKINHIDINAYFDYQNGIISVLTKFSKDSKEINFDDIVGHDISKVNTYYNYLDVLGFKDEKIEDDESVLNFFELDFSYLRSIASVYLSENITNKFVKAIGKTVVNIEKKNNIFEAFLVSSEYSEEELSKILKAIKKKKKFILLNNNQIVKLDEEANEFYNTLEDLNIDINKPLKPISLPTYQALKAYAHEKNCNIDLYLKNMVDDIKNYKDFDIEVPHVNATLRNYQIDGFKWLAILKKYHIGGILADDMGLGKTLQIITLLSLQTLEKPSLIVCPKSLVFNWKNEFEKFAPNLSVSEIYGSSEERKNIEENISNNKHHIYIISYDSLGRDIDTLSKYDYGFVILDEAQTIKNVYAKKSENVKLLKAEYRYALTGTPIENTVIDLWSLFDFLMPQYFEELSIFKSRYMHDESYTQVIAKMVAPFILRRTKKDVLKDLPSKYERIITCEMNTEQRKYYDAHVLEANNLMDAGANTFEIFPYLMRLRQICIDPGLFIENVKESGAKLEELYKIIDEYKSEHKMLIFSQFVSALNKVENHLNKEHIPYYIITGQTDAKERLYMCNKFNNDKTPIFLVSLKAGGTGLNLIGADTVIHIDPWWNSSAEDQATDRAHRIGQTRNVEIIKLITANSIEQRVIELQNYKKDIIDKLIASDDNRLTKVTLEDLAFILK